MTYCSAADQETGAMKRPLKPYSVKNGVGIRAAQKKEESHRLFTAAQHAHPSESVSLVPKHWPFGPILPNTTLPSLRW